MRRTFPTVAATCLLAGCGFFHRNLGVKDSAPAHMEPRSTSIFGDWILDTPADSTAFTGATLVELNLQPRAFVITATYPSRPQVVVRGTASMASTGLLTLVAESGNQTGTARLTLPNGTPVTLLASAAGNTLVFSPPQDNAVPEPSSVWHKRAAARAAGELPAAGRDSAGRARPPR